MAGIEEEIAKLRRDAEARGRELANAQHQVIVNEGRLEAVMADLQSEFEVDSIEAAKVKRDKLEAALTAAADTARQKLAQAGGQA